MEDDSRRFLLELREQTGGDPARSVSLYEVGRVLGWERPQALNAAQDLMAAGLVEIRSLSGAIAISPAGVSAAEGELRAAAPAAPPLRLGRGPVLEEGVRRRLPAVLEEIRGAAGAAAAGPAEALRRELEADLQTIAAQLASPRPNTAVVRETLRSIAETLAGTAGEGLAARLRSMLED